jgi:two-component system NarL family sensor kinase
VGGIPHEAPIERLARLRLRWLLAAAAALVALALGGVLTGRQGDSPGPVGMTVALALTYGPLAIFVLRRVPGHPLGRLMLGSGLIGAVAALSVCWSGLLVPGWLSQWLWLPPLVLIPFMLLRFPDGVLPSRRWWIVEVLLAASSASAVISLAAAAVLAPRTLLTTLDQPLPSAAQLLARIALAGVALLVLGTLVVAVGLASRWRAAGPLERRQLACLLPSAVLLVVGLVLDFVPVPGGLVAAVVALPLGLTVAILQYRLYDLDLFIHRGVVWLVLSALAVALYAVAVALGERMLADQGSFAAPLIAGALVAATLLPAARYVQRAVSRLLFGRRDDPYTVLTEVGRHVEAVADPLAVLPRFVTSLADELRVPYAAIALTPTGDDIDLLVEHGRRIGDPERFTMRAHGTEVGELLVAHRRPGERFSARETRLLQELAGQAAVAAEACRSTLEIQRARERLVFAREEERRRLRRDLHDGVASGLTGARMLAAAARRGVPADGQTSALLDRLAADLDSCSEEVRDLVDGLRPAALDRGLETALLELAARVPNAGPELILHVESDMGDLPAALEVVAYRVVAEALTNVIKHARATSCLVRLDADDHQLLIMVEDDGVGLPATGATSPDDPRHGVGLISIRSRVEEVGGRLEIVSNPTSTRLQVLLPVPHTPLSAGPHVP